MTIVFPAIYAVRPRARQTLRTVQIGMAVYIVIWAMLCLYVYTQYIFIE